MSILNKLSICTRVFGKTTIDFVYRIVYIYRVERDFVGSYSYQGACHRYCQEMLSSPTRSARADENSPSFS